MTLVAELVPDDLRRRLKDGRFAMAAGLHGLRIRSDVATIVEAVRDHYAHHRVIEGDDIVDVDVEVRRARAWRKPLTVRVIGRVTPLKSFPPAPMSHAVPMLETALNLGMAITGMDILTLHAGVVERGGRAIVMPGQSGSGKSTLTAALAHRGWRLLSDELALIRVGDGMLVPIVRPISLKNASIDVIRAIAPEAAIGRRYDNTAKGTIAYCRPPKAAVERDRECAPCGWFIFPTYVADSETRIVPMDKIVAFGRAFGQSGNYKALGEPAFETLTGLVDRCPAHALTFRDIDEAIACIERVTGTG